MENLECNYQNITQGAICVEVVNNCTCAIIVSYFTFTGYQCEQHNNPADFYLDVIIENEEADDRKSTSLCL